MNGKKIKTGTREQREKSKEDIDNLIEKNKNGKEVDDLIEKNKNLHFLI